MLKTSCTFSMNSILSRQNYLWNLIISGVFMVHTKLKSFRTILGIYLIFSEKIIRITWKNCKMTAHFNHSPEIYFLSPKCFLFVSKWFLVLLKYKIRKTILDVLYQNNSNQTKYYLLKNIFHSHKHKYSTLNKE